MYIGQTIRPIEQRFNRHINDATNNILDTHFARAIRKYGSNNFIIEVIDVCQSQEELNKKEQYWIQFYDSVNKGYNETDAIYKSGGNTYQSKTSDEMSIISDKIRISKLGNKNPNAKKIKCLNILTNEELIFDTVVDCQRYFNEEHYRFISERVQHHVKSLYKGVWNIAYFDDEYIDMNTSVVRKGIHLMVKDIFTGEQREFLSIRNAAKILKIERSAIEKYRQKGCNEFIIDKYKFTILD